MLSHLRPKCPSLRALLTLPRRTSRPLTLSAVQGPLSPPLVTKTLGDYFEQDIVAKFSNRPALICRQELSGSHGGPSSLESGRDKHLAWDYEEFERHINALARGLLVMGVEKGDRLGVIAGNNSSYAMLQLAACKVGAILVTMNPAYRIGELAATLKLVGVKHLFVVPQIRTSSYVKLLADRFPGIRQAQPGNIQEPDLPELRNLIVIDNQETYKEHLDKLSVTSAIDWREVLMCREGTESRRQTEIMRSLQKDDVMNLQFTSGTTGLPKAVSLTHSNLLNNGLSIGRCMNLSEKDILCNVPPLFHCFGLVLGNLAAWSHAAAIVYPSPVFDPIAVVDAVVAERCTALHGVPTHFLGILSEVEKRQANGEQVDLSSLRTGIAAGSPIPIELMKKLISKLNLRDLSNAYGMTETSPVSFQTTPDDPIVKRVETVGKVQPHVKAKIVDQQGNIVPVETPGELVVAGYLLQSGYWQDPAQTEAVMRTDPEDSTLWIYTGDEGILDKDGYLRIVGRIKDIIIRGGENLFPVQIENALTTNPAIHEAAAVAVPDGKYGEVVGAWIVRAPGTSISAEEVRKTVADNMNPQNAPGWCWFVGEHAEELPKTASGKVQKHILRDWSKQLVEKGVGRVK
ncbi:hypothetical protein C8J56DRAFT_911002 [Mycena floridula]|nr:hypothetical protein C8J56DRAFT_911002 [Mycena floridula]